MEKRLTITLPTYIHNEVKKRAIDLGINMKIYVLRALTDQMKKDRRYEVVAEKFKEDLQEKIEIENE